MSSGPWLSQQELQRLEARELERMTPGERAAHNCEVRFFDGLRRALGDYTGHRDPCGLPGCNGQSPEARLCGRSPYDYVVGLSDGRGRAHAHDIYHGEIQLRLEGERDAGRIRCTARTLAAPAPRRSRDGCRYRNVHAGVPILTLLRMHALRDKMLAYVGGDKPAGIRRDAFANDCAVVERAMDGGEISRDQAERLMRRVALKYGLDFTEIRRLMAEGSRTGPRTRSTPICRSDRRGRFDEDGELIVINLSDDAGGTTLRDLLGRTVHHRPARSSQLKLAGPPALWAREAA